MYFISTHLICRLINYCTRTDGFKASWYLYLLCSYGLEENLIQLGVSDRALIHLCTDPSIFSSALMKKCLLLSLNTDRCFSYHCTLCSSSHRFVLLWEYLKNKVDPKRFKMTVIQSETAKRGLYICNFYKWMDIDVSVLFEAVIHYVSYLQLV